MLVNSEEVDRVAAVLTRNFDKVAVRTDYGWPGNSALTVLDCVLSLNRRYDAFTLPRVKAFAEHHPEVTTLVHLNAMFAKYPEIGQFSRDALNYNDARRERTLRGVADYLRTIGPSYAGATEWERLKAWAQSVRPADAASIGVKGFGLAGVQ